MKNIVEKIILKMNIACRNIFPVTYMILLHFLNTLLRNTSVVKKHPQTIILWAAGG